MARAATFLDNTASRAEETGAVWAACFADLETVPDPWLACLDDPERAALARLRRPRDRLAYAGRHAMARAVLGEQVGRRPADLRYTTGPFGKPALLEPAAPWFSLSRTGELAVLAIHPNIAIGVDIERPGPIEGSIARLFSAREQAFLAGLPEPGRTETLYRLWVGKEAALKASGHGFSIGPERVEVRLESDGATATLHTDPLVLYALGYFALAGGVIGAIAAERPLVPVVRWWRRCQCRADCSACTTSLIA